MTGDLLKRILHWPNPIFEAGSFDPPSQGLFQQVPSRWYGLSQRLSEPPQFPPEPMMSPQAAEAAKAVLRAYLESLTPEELDRFAELNRDWLQPQPDPLAEVRAGVAAFLASYDPHAPELPEHFHGAVGA